MRLNANKPMRSSLVVLAFLGACIKLPHVEPQPRPEVVQSLTSVTLRVDCGEDEFWAGGKIGSGVIISERHVLTANHVTECPTIPDVHVTFVNGNGIKTLRMYVIKEDADNDIAKLEIASGEYFGLNIPPPRLWTDGNAEGEGACAYPGPGICGIVDSDDTIIKGMEAKRGNSGAAVYTQGLNYTTEQYTGNWGLLLGLIIRKGDGFTRIARVSPLWLEGT